MPRGGVQHNAGPRTAAHIHPAVAAARSRPQRRDWAALVRSPLVPPQASAGGEPPFGPPENRHARSLLGDRSSWACADCGRRDNLWLNLTSGHVGCGRPAWDGAYGGAGHALAHASATGFSTAVKLGTLSPDLASAEVYSYAEDELVADPLLRQHLAHFGIDARELQRTEQTIAEAQARLDATMAYDFAQHRFVSHGADEPAAVAASSTQSVRADCASALLQQARRAALDLGGDETSALAVALPPPSLAPPPTLREAAAACARAPASALQGLELEKLRRAVLRLSPRRHPVLPLGGCGRRTGGAADPRCRLAGGGPGRVLADRSAMRYLAAVFEAAAAGSLAALGVPIALDPFDLFHGHLVACPKVGLGLVLHAKEYPAFSAEMFPHRLGFCQSGSDLRPSARGLAFRNLLFVLLECGAAALLAVDCSPGSRPARELCCATVPAPLVYEVRFSSSFVYEVHVLHVLFFFYFEIFSLLSGAPERRLASLYAHEQPTLLSEKSSPSIQPKCKRATSAGRWPTPRCSASPATGAFCSPSLAATPSIGGAGSADGAAVPPKERSCY